MKKVLILMLTLLLMLPLMATQIERIDIDAVVPEDYSIVRPDAVSIDRLVVEIQTSTGEESLLTESEISLGELEVGASAFKFNLLYYGNLAANYDVLINASSNGLVFSGNANIVIPIEILIRRDPNCHSDIETYSMANDEMHLIVPPLGALEGESVLEFDVIWDNPRDLPLGTYSGTIDLELRSN